MGWLTGPQSQHHEGVGGAFFFDLLNPGQGIKTTTLQLRLRDITPTMILTIETADRSAIQEPWRGGGGRGEGKLPQRHRREHGVTASSFQRQIRAMALSGASPVSTLNIRNMVSGYIDKTSWAQEGRMAWSIL